MEQDSGIQLRADYSSSRSAPPGVLQQLEREMDDGRDSSSSTMDWTESERWDLFVRCHRYLDWKEAMAGAPVDGREAVSDEATRIEAARLALEPALSAMELQARLLIEASPAGRDRVIFEASGPDLWVESAIAAALREFILHTVRNSLAHAFTERDHSDFLAAPRVSVRVACIGDAIHVRVSDNGRGVDWDELLRLHERRSGRSVDRAALGPETALELLCSPWTSTAVQGGIEAGSGLGLMGLQSRILDFGGRLWISEKTLRGGDGFTLEARIPCRVLGGRCVRIGDRLVPSWIPPATPEGPGRFRYFHRVSPGWFPAIFDSEAAAAISSEGGMIMAALWHGELLPLAPTDLS